MLLCNACLLSLINKCKNSFTRKLGGKNSFISYITSEFETSFQGSNKSTVFTTLVIFQ